MSPATTGARITHTIDQNISPESIGTSRPASNRIASGVTSGERSVVQAVSVTESGTFARAT